MIKIWLQNDIPYVWNTEDACQLWENHRIHGTLVGSVPKSSFQNTLQGLPIQLLPEEATLLVEKGLAILVSHEINLKLPTEDDINKFHTEREASYQEQVIIAKEMRREQLIMNKDQIIQGKKKKRQKLMSSSDICKGYLDDKFEDNYDDVSEEEFNIEEIEIKPLPRKYSIIKIPTESIQADKSTQWLYPSTPKELLSYRVFKDLWEKGYHLTKGSKFGGDFLAYPGDPKRYHSFFIIICKDNNDSMTFTELAALGRLGTSVKKTVLICCIDEFDNVVHTSIEWSGIT